MASGDRGSLVIRTRHVDNTGCNVYSYFTLSYKEVVSSTVLSEMIEDSGDDQRWGEMHDGDEDISSAAASTKKELDLPNITTAVMSNVIEFIRLNIKSVEQDASNCIVMPSLPLTHKYFNLLVPSWCVSFFEMMEPDMIIMLYEAANYLDIQSLTSAVQMKLATMIKGRTVEEIRETFKIENDFTEDEEAEIRKQNEWCENVEFTDRSNVT